MTIQAAPNSIFNDLMGRLVDIVCEGTGSEWELKRLEREADKLEKVDRSGAFELRGHIAAAKGDEASTDDWFTRAIAISDDYTGSILRYLLVLGATVRGDKALETYRKYEPAIRVDPAALRQAQGVLHGLGFPFTAQSLFRDLERLGVKERDTDLFNSIDDARLSESDVAAVVQFSRRYLLQQHAPPKAIQSTVVPFEDGGSAVLYQFLIDRSPEVVSGLEWDLFGALDSADFSADKQRKVMFGLVPAGMATADANNQY